MNMASREKAVVVFCAHPISDPLVSVLMLDYIKKLRLHISDHNILLFTEEGPVQNWDPGLQRELADQRIIWHPLSYAVGGRQWFQRANNIWQMLLATRKFTRQSKAVLLIGFLSYGGSYAILVGKLLGFQAMTVCFEPHSQYMRELGIWSEYSLKYRLTEAIERLQIRDAFELVVPTRAVFNYVMRNGRKQEPLMQPITIDVEKAAFDVQQRKTIREHYGLVGRIVFVYAGKFGGIYHSETDHLLFIEKVLRADARYHYMVISSKEQIDVLRDAISKLDLLDRVTLLPPVPATLLHRYLSAADLGVIAIPPCPSQAFRTPVKTAYYWAAGLPIIIPKGISDDHELVAAHDLGVVIEDLVKFDMVRFKDEVDRLMTEDRGALRSRCLKAAWSYRDTSNMVVMLRRILKRAMSSHPSG